MNEKRNDPQFVLDEIVKLAGSVDSLFSSIHTYYDTKDTKSEEERLAKLKKGQIAFLKSLVVNDKAISSAKSKGFLYSVSLDKNSNAPLIDTFVKYHNDNRIVQNLKFRTDITSPLSLSSKNLAENEFSTEVLNDDSPAMLWAKILQWSNRATKAVDKYVKSTFPKDDIIRYTRYYNNLTSNLSIVNEKNSISPIKSILKEINSEAEFEEFETPNVLKRLVEVPRLTVENFIECTELMTTEGKDVALDEYSDIFTDENDYKKLKETIRLATSSKKEPPIPENEMDKFQEFLLYRFRTRRLYQAKALALSEFAIANTRENLANCYTRDANEISGNSSSSNARDKIFGIMLPQYSEPIEVHTSASELTEVKNRTHTETSKDMHIEETFETAPIKTGIPFKLSEQIIKNIDDIYSRNSHIYAAKEFLLKSYSKKDPMRYTRSR